MKIGVIGIAGKWSSERLADAVEERTGFRLLLEMKDLTVDLHDRRYRIKGHDLFEFDALMVKKVAPIYSHHMCDRLELLADLERQGVRIFSSPLRIGRAINRLTGTLELRKGGVPMPETVITEGIDEALVAVARFGRAVFKPLFTSKARGMVIIEDGPEALSRVREYRAAHPVMYIQRMVETPGKDLGVVFVGGTYLSTYSRVKSNDSWNTTTHSGGHYEAHDPSPEVIELARQAQDCFGLDFTSVDVAETPEGPRVFEVSAFGGFRGLRESRGLDAAGIYVDYVIKKLSS